MERYIISAVLLFVITACNNSSEVKADNKTISKAPVKNVSERTSTYDTVYENESVIVHCDTAIENLKILYTSLKFRPYISFDDFKVSNIDHSKKAPLNLHSHEYGRMFRTNLRNAYNDEEANFAGHYTLATWGCGSPCQMNLLVDRFTGKIYDAPTSSLGVAFNVNNAMLLVNPPDEKGFYDDCMYCIPEIYIFNEKTKRFTKKEPYVE